MTARGAIALRKVLVANRGEIACRVLSTCRALGIPSVAVFSDADREARHVALADEAVHIGPAPARDSYLRGDAILEAARATGADAIHPGYGFLSENADFAEDCRAAGVTFIGPPSAAIRAMGSKSAAKQLMQEAGVALVPGYHGDEQDAAFLADRAREIGYPVVIKASAGGGGRGMRIVAGPDDFEKALEGCRREASASFGDDHVLIERYLQQPRHIEVQVFADARGQCVHLFERDCSVQRRHQKVLEEAPAPGVDAQRREAMGRAAIDAARAVDYVGAGTVEFIALPDGRFYFMEMNTRLQVEHPVTEMITGLDLVEWQLRVAAGEALPLAQDQIAMRGHSIEARIYAEDPARGFLPSPGRLVHVELPETGEHVRVDTGFVSGDAITPHYDPMIAKLIVWGDTRDVALQRLRTALGQYRIAGVQTSVEFLGRVAANASFARGELDTGLIEREREDLLPKLVEIPRDAWLATGVYTLLTQPEASAPRELRLKVGKQQQSLRVTPHSGGFRVETAGGDACDVANMKLAGLDLSFDCDGRAVRARVVADRAKHWVFLEARVFAIALVEPT